MDLSPDDLAPRDRYKLLIGCIVPRPIALVSTVDALGRPNLAPFSFFNGIGSDPMTLLFCPANRPDGGEKDTLSNCKPVAEGGTGEFVVCASVEPLAREIAAAAEPLPRGESEFALTGLATAPSRRVRPARVARSPWAFECVTLQVVRTNPGAPSGGNVVIGRVVHVHLDDALVDPRLHVDAERLRAVGRMGGSAYARTRERFELPPGREALGRPDPFAEGEHGAQRRDPV
ncbi:MAG: flavin reductase family protein [Planctomycetes bacterium]|nr:flavin reductase family protein [Planctomycetota bacterium]